MSLDDLLPDSVFDGDPKKQFFGILSVCDPQAKENEILDLIAQMSQLELFLEEKGLFDEAMRSNYPSDLMDQKIKNYMIGAMARVVSQHER